VVVDTPAGRWRDVIHGRELDVESRTRLADILDDKRIALLER
jgi:maltooligosyltrehalose synthase